MNSDNVRCRKFRIQPGGALLGGLGKIFPMSARLPFDASSYALVHVEHSMPKGVRLKLKPLYGGVEGAIVSRLRGDTLLLLQRDLDDEKITVFGYDGSVQVIEFVEDRVLVRTLAPQDALQARLDSIGDDLWKIQDPELAFEDKARRQIEDKSLHQVADLLERAGRDTFMRKQVVAFAERTMSKMEVRGGVRKHFEEVLKSLGDTSIYGWLFGKPESSGGNVIAFPKAPLPKKNHRKAKVANPPKAKAEKSTAPEGGAKTPQQPKTKDRKQGGKNK